MVTARKNKDMGHFKSLKVVLDRLSEQKSVIESKHTETKFALRHDENSIHNCIDLISYTGREAVEITERRIKMT